MSVRVNMCYQFNAIFHPKNFDLCRLHPFESPFKERVQYGLQNLKEGIIRIFITFNGLYIFISFFYC